MREYLLLASLLMVTWPFALVRGLNAAEWIQDPATGPIRLGGGALQLSELDIATIQSMFTGDAKPWLLSGDIGLLPTSASIPIMGAFLPATAQTAEVRRGTLVTLRWPDYTTDSKTWTIIDDNGSYAQVAVAGRSFDQVQGDHALNRPFRIVGAIGDEDLLKIINVVRAKIPQGVVFSVESNARNQILVSLGFASLVFENHNQEWEMLRSESLIPTRNNLADPPLPGNLTPPEIILRHVESPPQ
jgi:hypothetical protein